MREQYYSPLSEKANTSFSLLMSPHWVKCSPSALCTRRSSARELCSHHIHSQAASFPAERERSLEVKLRSSEALRALLLELEFTSF